MKTKKRGGAVKRCDWLTQISENFSFSFPSKFFTKVVEIEFLSQKVFKIELELKVVVKMSSKDINTSADSIKISPTPSMNSDRDGSEDARKINSGKMMGESEDENMSGFETDSEDENNQHENGKKVKFQQVIQYKM